MRLTSIAHLEVISLQINFSLYRTKTSFRASLCDSFNTPEALGHLRELVSRTNVYINTHGKELNTGLVNNVATWIGDMLRMFGLGEGVGEKSEIGWGTLTLDSDDIVNVRDYSPPDES